MKHSESGFTLIEIVIVTAITAALTLIAFQGFGTLRETTQFHDGVEGAKESILAQRSQAIASINTNAGAGQDQTTINLGQLLKFSSGSSSVQLHTLTTTNPTTDPNSDPAINATGTSDPTSFGVKWGLTYTGYGTNGATHYPGHAGVYYVDFTRSRTDASPQVNAGVSSPSFYNNVVPPTMGTVQLYFRDVVGREAVVNIDLSDGAITRTYL